MLQFLFAVYTYTHTTYTIFKSRNEIKRKRMYGTSLLPKKGKKNNHPL